ncbi:UNVERIFIED_CONTAM: uroporphyrinogen III methyltransferase/synthase [Acetivibrio alkalicellulosi]
MTKGFVALVGAGPGEIGLLTLRGKEYIEKADVVVFDRLVSPEILDLIPHGAKKIDVGKDSGNHKVPQEDINNILLREAIEGNIVIRLKGGDPFLFGRGGEELELLVENNIPFEVVPGITSALSVPAYAGIPVTHRDFCSSVHIITGHQKKDEALKINYKSLCQMEGTLVFLMGVGALKEIMKGLIEANMDKATPAAIIEKGSYPEQRMVAGTIENIYEIASNSQIKSPSIIVVGKVCELGDKYDWFTKRPLFGKKIMVTRPKMSGNTLSIKLRNLGAKVYDFPCIEIEEIPNNEMLKNEISSMCDYSWLVFTSKNGVAIFFDYMLMKKIDFRVLGNIKIAAIGSQTAQSLKERGIIADFVPQIFDGEHLVKGLLEKIDKNDNVLLLRALMGTEEIPKILGDGGIPFKDIPIYNTLLKNENSQHMKKLIDENEVDFVTFTSASTVDGFINSMPKVDLSKVTGICIGDKTALRAKHYGIKHVISDEATIDSMITKILDLECRK